MQKNTYRQKKNFLRKGYLLLFVFAIILLIIATISGCSSAFKQSESKAAEKSSQMTEALTSHFADYQETPVTVTPAVKPYKTDPDLGNITNKDLFQFSPSARDL